METKESRENHQRKTRIGNLKSIKNDLCGLNTMFPSEYFLNETSNQNAYLFSWILQSIQNPAKLIYKKIKINKKIHFGVIHQFLSIVSIHI